MADKIQIKRSDIAGKKPTEGQLDEGELAINIKDRKIYAKDDEGRVQEFPAVDAVDVGVEKVNDLTGEITIKGSDNIDVDTSGQNITLNTTSNVALKSDLPDALNLIEGTGINITGDYPDLTITNEVTKIDDLSDVDTTDTLPQVNSVLTYDGSKWIPGTGGGSSDVENLPDLGDVEFPSDPTTGQILQYTDGKWKNVDVSAADGRTTVNGLGGPVTLTPSGSVSITQPDPNNDNEIVISASSGIPDANSDGNLYGRKNAAWVKIEDSGGGADTLSELTDTDISSIANDQFLRWDGDDSTGKWKNETVTLAPSDAQKNVQSDWNEESTSSDAFIKNKPELADKDAEKNVQSNWNETDATDDAFILNKPTKLSDFQDDLGYTDTDTGIVKLTHGSESVTGGAAREVTFKSSDASVLFELNADNEIDFTVPLAGLNIKGVVQYAQPQTQADGKITVNGTEYEVLWDPATYLDEAQSGVAGSALGDLWIVQYQGDANDEGTVADGNGYVYSLDESGNPEWSLVGPIQGPPGESAPEGVYLPLAGGEFDPGVNVLQPSGNSVQPNLQVGGKAGETPRPSFTVAAKSSISPDPNVQMVAWCAAENNNYYTGSSYFKFAHGQEDTDNDANPDAPMSYWNILAIPPQRQTVPELILNEAYDPDEAESNPDYNVPEYIESGVQLYDRTDYQLQIGGVVKPYDSADGNATGNQPFVQWVTSTSVDERRTIYNVPVTIVDTKGLYARNLQTMEGVDTDTRINLYKDNIRVMPQQAYPGYNLASNNDYALDVRMPNAKMRIRNDYGNLDTGDGPNDGSTSFRLDTGWNTATTRIELCSGGGLRGELRNEGTSGLFLQSQYSTSFVSGNRQAGYHNAGHWYMGDGPNPSKLSGFQSSAVTIKVESDQNRGGTGGYTGVQSAPSMPPAAKGNLMSFAAASYYVNDDTTNVFSYNADRPVGNLDNVRVENQSQITVGTYCGFRVGNPVKSKAGQNIGVYTGVYKNTLPARGFFGQYETVQIPNPDYIDEDTTPGVPPTVDQVNEILPPDPDYPADIQVNFKENIPSPDDLPPLQYGSDMTVGHPVNGDAYVITEGDYANRCYCLTGWDADVEDSGEWLIGKVEGFAYNNYAIYCDGSSPSRFNGDIQLSSASAITGTADTDTRLYIASGYLNLQIEKGSTGSVFAIRRLQGETTANAWTKYVSKTDDGTIENGWFGYEFDAKRYRFLESGGGYSAFAFDVNHTNQIAMRVPNGDTANPPMLLVSASTDSNTPKYSRSFKDIANASMPDGWEPSNNSQLATKKYVDDKVASGGAGGFPIESEPDGRVLIEADDDDGVLTSWVQCILPDTDPDKDVTDNAAYVWYVNSKPEYDPPYGSPGAPALRLTQQGVLETACATLKNGRDDFTGSVTGFGLEGIRNSVFYPHVQRAHDSRGNGDTGLEWDEVNYHFMRERNPLDTQGASPCEIPDLTSQGCAWESSLLTVREGGLGGGVHITAAADYTPTLDYDLVTKKYFDDNRVPLPNPDDPLPPVGVGAGYTWDQLERTPGLYLSGVYGIGGIYSIIGFSDMQAETLTDNNLSGIGMDLKCYWSTDGRTWTEGFVGGNWTAPSYSDSLYALATPNNKYGKFCDGAQVIFTGNAFTSTGKTWQGFNCDRLINRTTDNYIGEGVPFYWDSGVQVDQAVDPDTGTYPGTTLPEGACWVTSRMYAIADLEDDDISAGALAAINNNAPTTKTDVQLTNLGDVISPKVFFSLNGNDTYYFNSKKMYKPLQSEAAIKAATKTDPLATYFENLEAIEEYADACCSPDGKVALTLDSSNNQFYWWVHKRTTLTVPTGLWQETGLCCAYDRSRGYFAAATGDTVRVYEAPATSGTFAYGGRLLHTYTIPNAAEWTHFSISGGVYILMSKSGAIARLDTNNPLNDTFEMIGANSPAVFSANPVLAGTNGRFLITGGEDVGGLPDFGKGYGYKVSDLPPPGPPSDPQQYAWSGGDNDPGAGTTTENVELTDPVDTGGGGRSTRKLLTTQKDANEYFAEEIAKRAVVVTLTQAEYDALSPPDENTLYLIT